MTLKFIIGVISVVVAVWFSVSLIASFVMLRLARRFDKAVMRRRENMQARFNR